MNRQEQHKQRRLLSAIATMVFGAVSLAAPAGAQSGVVMGNGEEILHLLDNSGGIAVDFDVDDVNTTQQIVFGRADLAGSDEMDIDLVLIDNDSTLSADDPSIFLNSSGADIRLGSGSASQPGKDGDLFLSDGFGATTFSIDGSTGNVDQFIDNIGTQTDFDGNGAVKAWAIIDPDGDVLRCWNCNTSTAETQQISTGRFEVDFTIGAIENRPVLVTRGCPFPAPPSLPLGQCEIVEGFISVSPRASDASSYHVRLDDEAGEPQNTYFTIVVF